MGSNTFNHSTLDVSRNLIFSYWTNHIKFSCITCCDANEGNVLFNNTLNTFTVIWYWIKDHSDNKSGNQLLPFHGVLLSITSNVLYVPSNRQGSMYHSHRALLGMRNILKGPLRGTDVTIKCTLNRRSTPELRILHPKIRYQMSYIT